MIAPILSYDRNRLNHEKRKFTPVFRKVPAPSAAISLAPNLKVREGLAAEPVLLRGDQQVEVDNGIGNGLL